MTRPGAIVLCGGQSRRMGQPKAWLRFGDELMLQRVVRLLGTVAGPIVVVAAPGQEVPELPEGVTIVRDPVSDQGPLRGIAAGLTGLPHHVELAYATATDVPFLRPEWVNDLVKRIGEGDLAIPEIGGFLHPLAALYRRATVLPEAERLLGLGRLRPVFLLEGLRGVRVSEAEMSRIDPGLGTLRNLNTPEDYRQAIRDAGFETFPSGSAPDDGSNA